MKCPAPGDECVFVAADGASTISERGSPDAVACAVQALTGLLDAPYRAVAVRRHADTWAVGAVSIEVAELPGLGGDEATLVVTDEGATLEVDGRPTLAGMETLERLAAGRARAYVLRAARLEADVWEFTIDPL